MDQTNLSQSAAPHNRRACSRARRSARSAIARQAVARAMRDPRRARPQSRRPQASPAYAAARAPRPRSAASPSRAARRPCAPAIAAELGARAVDRIAEDRPALRSAMDPQLVGASRLRLKFEPGDRRAAPDTAALDSPEGQRLLPVRIDLHPPAALVVEPAERQIDRAAPRPPARRRRSPNRSCRSCPA